MPHVTRRPLAGLLFALSLSAVTLAQTQNAAETSAADEAALGRLAADYYAAYAREDADGLLRLWSGQSPELAAARQRAEQQFAALDRFELKGVRVTKSAVTGARARLRVEVEMSAVEARTGKPAAGLGKLLRALECVKEEGAWRVWREASAYDELAAALGEAKTDEARQALLAADEGLIAQPLVDALISQGHRHRQRGQFAPALVSYRTARGVAERLGDRRGLAQALSNIGVVHGAQSDYAQALPFLEQGLKLAEELNDKTTIGFALNGLGNLHRLTGNIELALDFLGRSLKLAEELGNQTSTAIALFNLGSAYLTLGDHTQALSHYERGLALVPPTDKDLRQAILQGLGVLHRRQGNYELALDYYQQSLRLAEEIGSKDSLSLTLNNLGMTYRLQGKPDLALAHYQRALALSEETGVKGRQGMILNNIGIIHRARGQYDQAIKAFEQSLKLRESIGEREGAAYVLYSLAFAHQKQGRFQEALAYAERAIALARQINSPDPLWNALLTKAAVYKERGQVDVARQAYEEAIAVIEEKRGQVAGGASDAQRFFEGRVFPYHALVGLLAAQGQVGAALPVAERAKARALLDVLHSGRADLAKSLSAAEREQEQRLNRELVTLNTQLAREQRRAQPDAARVAALKAELQQARLTFEAFQTTLYATHPELRTQRGEAQPIRLEEVAALLPDARTALLEFVVSDEQALLFVFTKGRAAQVTARIYPLPVKGEALGERAAAFRQQLARRDPEFGPAARELYDLLLKPAAAQLQGTTRLVIVPDGPLWNLPFQALQTAPNRFLIETHAVSYAPSLTVLREMVKLRQRKTAGAATLLALGNPALGVETVTRAKTVLLDEKFDPLPEAAAQVRQLAAIYGARRSRVYTGAEAREERVKKEAGNYRILHLATHGVLNDASPLYSHMLLAQTAGEDKEDGLLEAWELMKLDLNADLVVLSACETARGRVSAGEGVIGLTWALFVAGCPRTVVSQWKVEAASTADLMVEFHRRLKARNPQPGGAAGAAQALRAAAVKMLGGGAYRHPFWWAGFVVIGDGH
jgi:CHAT domain-containing protein/Tfp pilus assembly protein PilF